MLAGSSEATVGDTTRVSVATDGTQANGPSRDTPSISADGRFVAFESDASNLVPNDTNGATDIFVHDSTTGTTERVSLDSSGNQGRAFAIEMFQEAVRQDAVGWVDDVLRLGRPWPFPLDEIRVDVSSG